jgi:hypothetical protein
MAAAIAADTSAEGQRCQVPALAADGPTECGLLHLASAVVKPAAVFVAARVPWAEVAWPTRERSRVDWTAHRTGLDAAVDAAGSRKPPRPLVADEEAWTWTAWAACALIEVAREVLPSGPCSCLTADLPVLQAALVLLVEEVHLLTAELELAGQPPANIQGLSHQHCTTNSEKQAS